MTKRNAPLVLAHQAAADALAPLARRRQAQQDATARHLAPAPEEAAHEPIDPQTPEEDE